MVGIGCWVSIWASLFWRANSYRSVVVRGWCLCRDGALCVASRPITEPYSSLRLSSAVPVDSRVQYQTNAMHLRHYCRVGLLKLLATYVRFYRYKPTLNAE